MLAPEYLGGAAVLQQHTVDLHLGQHGQVRPLADRLEKCLGRIPAYPGLLIDLKVAAAFVIALVEVADVGNAALRRGVAKRIQDRPRQSLLFYPPFAAIAVEFRAAGKMVFALLEQRQHVFPGPAGVACRRPAVIVLGLAAHVDHAVDGGTAPQHLAAWITQGAALQALLGFGLEAPVGARVTDTEQVADGDMDPGVIVATTGFEQQHAVGGVGGQSIGQQATRGAGAYYHVIVLRSCNGHLRSRLFFLLAPS